MTCPDRVYADITTMASPGRAWVLAEPCPAHVPPDEARRCAYVAARRRWERHGDLEALAEMVEHVDQRSGGGLR